MVIIRIVSFDQTKQKKRIIKIKKFFQTTI